MVIDLSALRRATEGDPTKKVAVNRSWLKEVHSELLELEQHRARMAKVRSQMDDESWDEGWQKFDQGFESIFGKSGAFDKLFGRLSK